MDPTKGCQGSWSPRWVAGHHTYWRPWVCTRQPSCGMVDMRVPVWWTGGRHPRWRPWATIGCHQDCAQLWIIVQVSGSFLLLPHSLLPQPNLSLSPSQLTGSNLFVRPSFPNLSMKVSSKVCSSTPLPSFISKCTVDLGLIWNFFPRV
jgi:hypothetical protein